MAQTVGKPHNEAAARCAAALRMVGATQVEAADAAGVGLRTLQSWEVSDWWPDMMESAREDLHTDLERFSYRTLLRAVKADEGDAQSARWLLERLRPKTFKDATPLVEVGGTHVTVVVPDPRARQT